MFAKDSFASRRQVELLRTLAEVFFGDSPVSTLDRNGGRLRKEGCKPVFAKLEDFFGNRSYFKFAGGTCGLEVLNEQRSEACVVETAT